MTLAQALDHDRLVAFARAEIERQAPELVTWLREQRQAKHDPTYQPPPRRTERATPVEAKAPTPEERAALEAGAAEAALPDVLGRIEREMPSYFESRPRPGNGRADVRPDPWEV